MTGQVSIWPIGWHLHSNRFHSSTFWNVSSSISFWIRTLLLSSFGKSMSARVTLHNNNNRTTTKRWNGERLLRPSSLAFFGLFLFLSQLQGCCWAVTVTEHNHQPQRVANSHFQTSPSSSFGVSHSTLAFGNDGDGEAAAFATSFGESEAASSSSSHAVDDGGIHGSNGSESHHKSYHVASLNFDSVQTPFAITLWVFIATLAKIGK